MSWFEGKKKWIAGGLAGIGGIIAVDQGLRRSPEVPRSTDASAKIVKDPQQEQREMEEALRASSRRSAEDRARERDQEQIAKMKQGIDALFQQGGGLEAEVDKQLMDLEQMIKQKFSQFPDARVEEKVPGYYTIVLSDAPGHTVAVEQVEDDYLIYIPVRFKINEPELVEYQKINLNLLGLNSAILKRIEINEQLNKFHNKEITSEQLTKHFRDVGLQSN